MVVPRPCHHVETRIRTGVPEALEHFGAPSPRILFADIESVREEHVAILGVVHKVSGRVLIRQVKVIYILRTVQRIEPVHRLDRGKMKRQLARHNLLVFPVVDVKLQRGVHGQAALDERHALVGRSRPHLCGKGIRHINSVGFHLFRFSLVRRLVQIPSAIVHSSPLEKS